ncbi:hypothetical protein QFZ81_003984 [Paenibacillus sp. V4I9]|nr:hypothetical protein [Paenibacillus sp. V4I9]
MQQHLLPIFIEVTEGYLKQFTNTKGINVGYATPDDKVFAHLAEHLPKWASNNNVRINVNTSKDLVDGKMIYRIWITPFNE